MYRIAGCICRLLVFLSVTAGAVVYGEEGIATESWIESGWDSKYVSEGRRNLDEGGLAWIEAGVVAGEVAFAAWYGRGDSETYDEVNLSAAWVKEWNNFETALSYTRLEFPEDHAHDNEVALSLSCEGPAGVIASMTAVYSTQAEGTFVEAGMEREFESNDMGLILIPFVAEGVDFGYASTEYDGFNNLQAGAELVWQVGEDVSLSAYMLHSWAHGDVKRDDGGNISAGGAAVSAQF
ncbi:MAG: hypothetical protein KJ626_16225 [Verrucomicrobia bacterium]|nr:hypothetical protein [Verrucomicrobiota bacterium]